MRVAVQHAAVADLAARLALTVRELEHELDALEAEAQRLTASWNGDAQRAYQHAQREWSRQIHRMKALLAEATRRLITANAISMETAATAARIWA